MSAFRPGWFTAFLLVAWCLAAGAPVQAAEPRAVAVWIPGPSDSLAARQIAYFLKRVEERLPHHFAFDVQTGTACPSEPDLLNQTRSGKVDIVVVGDAVIDEVPRLSMFRLPWLFRNRDHVQQAMYAGLEDEIRSHVEETLKVVVVGIYENSFHQIRADRAISGPEDLSHRKILINDGRKMRDLMRSLGAVPQKYPAEKADEALENGIVDSFDGPLDALARLPIGEKLPVITLTQHVYEPSFVIASHAFWEKLTDAERAAITEIGLGFSDTAAQLAVTYLEAVRKRLPKRVLLQAFVPNRFASIAAQRRAAYEKTFGTDWMELIDIDDEGQRTPR